MEYAGNVIMFIGLICFTWLFAIGSEPIQFIKKLANVESTSKSRKTFLVIIRKLVNCCLCSGFWIGLIYYQDILLGSLTAICSELFYQGYSRLTNKL